jgi:hypothetical protein
VTLETRLTLSEALGTGIILGMMRLPVRIQTTLMEGKLLANQISRFLESELKIPTYVTVAQQIPPNSPHFMLPTPGVFKAQYAALRLAPPELRAKYAYASAALPYGIFGGDRTELEDELCSFESGSTDSPDRLDALVWGITDLMLGGFQELTSFHVPVVASRPRQDFDVPFVSVADGACDNASAPPGGWPMGSPGASGLGGTLAWWPSMRRN